MSKLNREEYEILKSLEDKWKWIAVNGKGWLLGFTSIPDKRKGRWSNGEQQVGLFNDKVNGLDRELFRFIKSSDPEPYSIAELIEEYEYHNEPVKLAGGLSITQAKFDKYLEEHIKELENENKERELSLVLEDTYDYEVEEQKYYARIKGYELISDSEDGYWNVDGKELFIDNAWHDYSGCKITKLTKNEWIKLGINEDNADFIKLKEEK